MTQHLKDNIIQKAWDIVQEDSKIKKFYFIPGLISIIFLTLILVYQTIYTYVVFFNQQDKALNIILNVVHSAYIKEVLIWWWIFLVIYMLLTPLCEWTLIWYISKKADNEYVSVTDSFWNWLYKFLPFFEYSNLFSQFKFISIVNMYLFCLRFVWLDYISLVNWIFLFLLFISTIINILFAYSRYEIILNNKKALESIATSVKIAILNFWTTTKLYFFMFLVSLRVIINFIVFLVFPILIVSAITYITSQIFLIITIIIFSLIFLFLIIILWYMWWVLDIFKLSIRYFAYIEWKKKLAEVERE